MTSRQWNTFLFRSSQQLPRLCLGPMKWLFDLTQRPSRALDSPRALLPKLYRNKGTVRCAVLGAKVPRHHQIQVTQTLIVRLLKMHFFRAILDCVKSTEQNWVIDQTCPLAGRMTASSPPWRTLGSTRCALSPRRRGSTTSTPNSTASTSRDRPSRSGHLQLESLSTSPQERTAVKRLPPSYFFRPPLDGVSFRLIVSTAFTSVWHKQKCKTVGLCSIITLHRGFRLVSGWNTVQFQCQDAKFPSYRVLSQFVELM